MAGDAGWSGSRPSQPSKSAESTLGGAIILALSGTLGLSASPRSPAARWAEELFDHWY